MKRSLTSANNFYFTVIAILLFFLNSVFLGGRLSLVLLLSPLWLYLSQYSKAGIHKGVLISGLILISYFPFHYINGIVSLSDYFQSLAVFLSVLLFINVTIYYIKNQSHQLDSLFRSLLILNALFALISLLLLFVPELKNSVWYIKTISEGLQELPRLKLFTPEASHYSLVISPIFIYFFIRCLFFKVERAWFVLLLASFPLLLSFSLGVLGALGISFLILLGIKYKQWFLSVLPPKKILLIALILVAFLALLYYLFPDNPLYVRIQNLMEGKDTSGRGRTYESFILADKIAALKSKIIGIGPGQLKLIGKNTIVQYYNYMNIPESVRIPNATAETLAYYGYLGLLMRIGIQIFLFVKTKVWNNPFRLWLFLFIFIYQLTGSYINNSYEYMLWILVFTPVFKDLNFTKKTLA